MEIEIKDEIIMTEDADKYESNEDHKTSQEKENIEIELVNHGNEGNDGDTPIAKKSRKKRRTKDEIDGRDYICSICQKAYLSYPALTNHRKSKHPNFEFHPPLVIDDKKKRGRPKKNLFASFIADYENKIKNLFDYEPRKNTTDNFIEIADALKLLTEENLDMKMELANTKFLQELTQNKLNTEEISNKVNPENTTNSSNTSIDIALLDFIKFSHNKITDEYLLFLLKFIFLFRKFIITSCESKIDTSVASSDLIPDYSNDFFIFMSNNNFFNLYSEENKLEMVSLMQYLCFWLLENRYTKSKLLLLQK
jgi:hypothetical protein